MSGTEQTNELTEGGLVGPLVKLAWPIVVIQLLQVTYNVVDTLWLGRLSADAVGAISLAFPVIFLLIAFAGGFTAAGAILVAQYTGAKGRSEAGKVAGQTFTFIGALSVAIGLVGYLVTRDVLAILPSQAETTERVIPLAADYVELIFLGLPLMFGFFVFSALMRGHGDTKTPMYVMFVSVVVNIVLDPFLIFGWGPFPHLGIEGAAIATILARGVGTGIGLYLIFFTEAGPAARLEHLYPDLSVIRDIVDLGVPASIEQSMAAFAMTTIIAMVVVFSPPVVAAYGLGNRIISLVFLPAMGLGRATDALVGQNLGAGRPDRASRTTYLAAGVSAGVLLVLAVIAAVTPEPIVSVFLGDVPDAAATIAYGEEYLRIRSVEFAFIGVTQVVLGAFRGAGNTKTAMAFSILTLWVTRVPVIYLLAFPLGWGATGIWVGMAAGNVVGGIASFAWFTRGTWKEAYIDREEVDAESTPADDGERARGADLPELEDD
ncbi:MAG: MATE family efflux transporter [Halobacteriota archaeon]